MNMRAQRLPHRGTDSGGIKVMTVAAKWLLCLLLPVVSAASESSAPVRSVTVGSRQEFNTYLWNAELSFLQPLSKRWQLLFGESFKSSMLRLSSEGDRWKDDQSLQTQLSYDLLPALRLYTRGRALSFYDRQSGFNNDLQTSSAVVGAQFSPGRRLTADLSSGMKSDFRLGHRDRGFTYDAALSGRDLEWQGYDQRFEFALDEDRFARRRNSNMTARWQVGKNFSGNAADTLRLYVGGRRRDNYLSAGNDLESQKEEIKSGTNVLHYRLTEGMNLVVASQFEFKNVELAHLGETAVRRRKRNDQKIGNDLSLLWLLQNWQGEVSLSHLFLQQKYDLASDSDRPFSSRIAFVTPDNVSSRFVLNGRLQGRIGADSLTLAASANRFRYDTPDTANFDDRDELRINTRAAWMHRFSPELRTEWTAGVNLYHMVYIYGERSADNNWNRIIFLRPELIWTPSRLFFLHQSFEVLANYVAYDFEESPASARSFAFRKMAINDSLRWQIMPRTALLADYRLQLEENGRFSWKDWSERIVGTRTLQWLNLSWQFTAQERLSSSAGFAVFNRREWRHSTDVFGRSRRDKAGTFLSRGPVLRLRYAASSLILLQVDASRYLVSSDGRAPYFVNSIELAVRCVF